MTRHYSVACRVQNMVRIATTLAGIAPNELRSLRDMFRTRGQRIKVGNENAK